MISTIDRLVRERIAQPAVDALEVDTVRWPKTGAQASSSAFIISALGIAGIFAVSMLSASAAATLVLGSAHVFSVRVDAYTGRVRRHNALAAFGRVFQLAETVGSLFFLAYVAGQGLAIWTALVSVFVAGLILANAVAYVGICDAPPPRRRSSIRSPSRAAA